MVVEFFNQEREYQTFLDSGQAFVCNNLGMGPETHRIHVSQCNMLNRTGPAKTGMHTSVRKACSRDLSELVGWVVARFGPEHTGYEYCAFCLRDRRRN
jgi:hypothetical protein